MSLIFATEDGGSLVSRAGGWCSPPCACIAPRQAIPEDMGILLFAFEHIGL